MTCSERGLVFLTTITHELSQALAGWFQDQGREADAAPIDLTKETSDFERLIADSAAAISRRKSLTAALRPKFADLLAQMDRLVLRFRRTEAGTAWQAARTIRDLGTSGPAPPATCSPPSTQPRCLPAPGILTFQGRPEDFLAFYPASASLPCVARHRRLRLHPKFKIQNPKSPSPPARASRFRHLPPLRHSTKHR